MFKEKNGRIKKWLNDLRVSDESVNYYRFVVLVETNDARINVY